MAYVAANIQAPLGAVATLRVVDSIRELKNAFVEWNGTRVTRNQLLRLSGDQLKDIGLTRADLF
jgi:uncharacterized protein YjiS (DUF1127 family)